MLLIANTEAWPGIATSADLLRGGKPGLDALAWKRMDEQIVGAAIELANRNDVVAHTGNGLDGIGDRRHARGQAQGSDATLHFGDTRFEHRRGGIHDARVDVPRHLEVEQVGAMLGVVEGIGRRLVDRHRGGLGRGLRFVAVVQGN